MPAYLNVPVLGVIPSSKADPERLGYGKYWPVQSQRRALRSESEPLDPLAQINKSHPSQNGNAVGSVELITWQRKLSLLAEAFRATLTTIRFLGRNGDRPRIIVFTSAVSSEGKTTIVSNLGIAVAETNQRVLLIDADLRRPRLYHVRFEAY